MTEKVDAYISELPEEIRLTLMGKVDNEEGDRPPLFMRVQPDGTLRTHSLQVFKDENGDEAVAVVGPNGQQFTGSWVYDYNASTWRVLRGDPNGIQFTRPYEGYIYVAPALVPNPEGNVWVPTNNVATELWEVYFKIVNIDAGAAAVTVSIGGDDSRGGALAAQEYWLLNEVINYPGHSEWQAGGIIRGSDQVRAVAGAANDAVVHFMVRRVDEIA